MLDFKEYIHELREKTINKIEPYLNNDRVKRGLEIGAGDGFQSRLLIEYLDKLVVTEYDTERLVRIPNDKIDYYISDAENLEKNIGTEKFDLIFSSHLLEHLPNVQAALKSCHNLTKNDGIIIHNVPSFWYSFFRLLFWYPSIIKRFLGNKKRLNEFNLLKKNVPVFDNNLKKNKNNSRKIWRFLIPQPHGVSRNVLIESIVLRKSKWKKLFKSEQFEIIMIINGSCFSGYGFGFTRSKRLLSKLGIACEYIFILKKKSDD